MHTINLDGVKFVKTLGEEQTVTVGGDAYRLPKFVSSLMVRWVEWAKSYLPDPMDDLARVIHKFPPALQTRMYEDALRKKEARATEQDQEIGALWLSVPGQVKALSILLQQGQPMPPDVAEDIAKKAVDQLGSQEVHHILERSTGVRPVLESDVETDFFRPAGDDARP